MPAPPLFDLTGKTAVVTGASGPLGRRLAEALAMAGASTLLVGRREDALARAVDEISAKGGTAQAFAADVSKQPEVERLGMEVDRAFGALDVLVNGAARASGKPIEEMTLEEWEATQASALSSAFLCTQALGERMKGRGGSIVNIGSIYGAVSADPSVYPEGMAGSSVDYAAAKAGLLGLTRYVAVHWAAHNIRCNCLSPGGVASPRNDNAEFRRAYCERTPLGRMAQGRDVAGALVFLASEASAYVTGQNLLVDGGWTAR
jgi:NAD(P)-dependent dehydrogenase (short-subunit alcohol dehydrogenase family)